MSSIPPSPQRLNVLEVIGNAIVGGMENYVLRLIERMPPERFNVVALCPFESPFTDQLREHQVEVVIAAMPEDPPWSSIHLGSALVKAHGIDVLHAHLSNAHVLAGLVGRLTGKPVLATIHGRQLITQDVEVHRATGTHLSVVCKHSYFQALGLGVNPSQLHCILNGVDTQRFQIRRAGAAAWRKQWGIPADAPLVGFAGRLSPEKGPDVFLRAVVLMRQMMPQAHFVMVGEGPMESRLRQFMAQFELGSCVHLTGVQKDMPAAFNALDVVLSTSHTEAMPFALMEAMSCGVPVVAPRVGGVPDLIQHGQTGWLFTPGNEHEAAQRVVELLKAPEVRVAMGERGRERCVERLSMDTSAQSMMNLLARLGPARNEQRRISAVVNPAKLNGALTQAADKAASA